MRQLRIDEIEILERQACRADSWQNITVADQFNPHTIYNVRFSGKIELGCFDETFTSASGVQHPCGLRNVALHNCHIGNNVLIENVANYIANYRIEEHCRIQNIQTLEVTGKSRFGNGTEVSVLNETGGREVPIFNELSAQLAYIIALYRHRPNLIARLKKMIARYGDNVASEMGSVGCHSVLLNAGTIRNVNIGEYSMIEGASRLENGSINSNRHDPVQVGYNVIAQDFIFCSGAVVTDGAALIRCFVGQACHLGHLFSAHDSLFFSNCQGENGEACAIFAGPYTVSMHKSSLLIAGMFSFLNAGSGSNQSNHMYKLGPIHQGIVERGSKTTSDSYVLWPAKIGAFSLIMGRHVRHSDTSNLPFSYLIEKGDNSFIVPGINLKSVGTIRDAQKWPKRDKRKDPNRLDCINFNLLSPYTIAKMERGIEVLLSLQQTSGETSEIYSYQSACIKNSSLKRGILLYTKAIQKFLGNSVIKRLENGRFDSDEAIRERLQPTAVAGEGEWVDLAGLIAPKTEIDRLTRAIEKQEIVSPQEINRFFASLHNSYYDLEWTWAARLLERQLGKPINRISAKDIAQVVHEWEEAVVSLDELLYEDAKKEFSMNAQTGFGVDGSDRQKQIDFESVRGDFESNPFVAAVRKHITDKTALGEELINRLSPLL